MQQQQPSQHSQSQLVLFPPVQSQSTSNTLLYHHHHHPHNHSHSQLNSSVPTYHLPGQLNASSVHDLDESIRNPSNQSSSHQVNNVADHSHHQQRIPTTIGETNSSSSDQLIENRVCYNCRTTNTPLWRRFGAEQFLCNACGLYQRVNGAHRPLVRNVRRHSTTTRRVGLTCANCGTKATSMWRRNSMGDSVCNACGLYFRLNGVNRPPTMRKETIRTRRRRTIKTSMMGNTAAATHNFFNTSYPSGSSVVHNMINNHQQLLGSTLPVVSMSSGSNHSIEGIISNDIQSFPRHSPVTRISPLNDRPLRHDPSASPVRESFDSHIEQYQPNTIVQSSAERSTNGDNDGMSTKSTSSEVLLSRENPNDNHSAHENTLVETRDPISVSQSSTNYGDNVSFHYHTPSSSSNYLHLAESFSRYPFHANYHHNSSTSGSCAAFLSSQSSPLSRPTSSISYAPVGPSSSVIVSNNTSSSYPSHPLGNLNANLGDDAVLSAARHLSYQGNNSFMNGMVGWSGTNSPVGYSHSLGTGLYGNNGNFFPTSPYSTTQSVPSNGGFSPFRNLALGQNSTFHYSSSQQQLSGRCLAVNDGEHSQLSISDINSNIKASTTHNDGLPNFEDDSSVLTDPSEKNCIKKEEDGDKGNPEHCSTDHNSQTYYSNRVVEHSPSDRYSISTVSPTTSDHPSPIQETMILNKKSRLNKSKNYVKLEIKDEPTDSSLTKNATIQLNADNNVLAVTVDVTVDKSKPNVLLSQSRQTANSTTETPDNSSPGNGPLYEMEEVSALPYSTDQTNQTQQNHSLSNSVSSSSPETVIRMISSYAQHQTQALTGHFPLMSPVSQFQVHFNNSSMYPDATIGTIHEHTSHNNAVPSILAPVAGSASANFNFDIANITATPALTTNRNYW